MSSAKSQSDIFSKFAENPRVRVRRPGVLKKSGKCVVYWMQRAKRGNGNAALNTAIQIANELNLPVVVFFSVIPSYPNANLRHYYFMGQAFPEIAEDLKERGIGFILRRHPDNSLERFLEEVDAAVLIGDENPCREPERWRQVLAKRLKIPFWTVDADVVVPSSLFSKHFYLLHHFRPKLYAELPKYLEEESEPTPQKEWKLKAEGYLLGEDITRGFNKLDRSVLPVDTFVGGPHAARKKLRDFIAGGLKDYSTHRNHPELDGTSQLSPYLHFGHIGPGTIVLEIEKAVKKGRVSAQAKDSFLNELVGWRELSVNFVRFTPNYDSWECAEPWAKGSLLSHANDRRQWIYSLEQLEKAQTHDELWNAGQMQMVQTGWMHNYLRMYWAKKILEWTPNPATAFEYAVILNDKYELDGRDPNGYAGIAWSIVGTHDRPWFERPIFGTVRYMSSASTSKKFNSDRYIRKVTSKEAQLWRD
jgi:deoxyribodipyrimidine photo-lyase